MDASPPVVLNEEQSLLAKEIVFLEGAASTQEAVTEALRRLRDAAREASRRESDEVVEKLLASHGPDREAALAWLRALIQEGADDLDAGRVVSWESVKDELRARYGSSSRVDRAIA